jgi:hypothetical protein
MKIKKNTFTTLVLELFFPSIANCRKLKIQKSTSPTLHVYDSTYTLPLPAQLKSFCIMTKLSPVVLSYPSCTHPSIAEILLNGGEINIPHPYHRPGVLTPCQYMVMTMLYSLNVLDVSINQAVRGTHPIPA